MQSISIISQNYIDFLKYILLFLTKILFKCFIYISLIFNSFFLNVYLIFLMLLFFQSIYHDHHHQKNFIHQYNYKIFSAYSNRVMKFIFFTLNFLISFFAFIISYPGERHFHLFSCCNIVFLNQCMHRLKYFSTFWCPVISIYY